MRRAVVSELLHRRSRSLALLLGILVATAAFTVLTGTSETQRLEARGTVERSFRGDYDVLVRPRGSRSAIERRSGQAPPNFLSELYEGITHAQWRRIQRLPGIEVAAPIANVGYVFPTARVPVDVSQAAGTRGRVLLRARLAWRSERGLTRALDKPNYAYVTPNRLRDELWWADPEREGGYYLKSSLREDVPGRRRPCPSASRAGSSSPRR